MGWKVVIARIAADEINDAIDWYSQRSKPAASKLMSDLAKRLNSLEINPHFTKRYKKIYCLPLKKNSLHASFPGSYGKKRNQDFGIGPHFIES